MAVAVLLVLVTVHLVIRIYRSSVNYSTEFRSKFIVIKAKSFK